MKKEITVEDLKDASELNKWTYQAFKKIVEFNCKARRTPAPFKINNVKWIDDLDGQRNFIQGTCEFSGGVSETFTYPLAWIFDAGFNHTGTWRQMLADKAASEIYKNLSNVPEVTSPLFRTYDISEGSRHLTYIQAHCDMDAIEMFFYYMEEHGKAITSPTDICGISREDDDECLDTWEHKVKE